MENRNIGDPVYNEMKAKRLAFFEKYLEENEEESKETHKENPGKYVNITDQLTFLRKPELKPEIGIFTNLSYDIIGYHITGNKIGETGFQLHAEPGEEFIQQLNARIDSSEGEEHFFLIREIKQDGGCGRDQFFVPDLEAVLETEVPVRITGKCDGCLPSLLHNTVASKVRELIRERGKSPERNEEYFEVQLVGLKANAVFGILPAV